MNQDAVKVRAITAMAVAFGREVDEMVFFAYLQIGLADMTAKQVEEACGAAIRQSKFFPSVSELRELAGGSIDPQSRAVIAWEALQRAIRQVGYYRAVVFDDPATTAAVRIMGGWQRVCVRADEEKDWDTWGRKQFTDTYLGVMKAGVRADLAQPLIGYADEQNGVQGYGQKQPARIACGLPPVLVRRAIGAPVAEVANLGATIGRIEGAT